ncbi:MAG: hypothetical protein ACPLPR_08595 [Bacillota bacterium]
MRVFEYWPIMGYGVAVEPEMIDFRKAAGLLTRRGVDPEDKDLYTLIEALFEDVIPQMPRGPAYYLMYSDEGELAGGDVRIYLYLPPYLPWNLTQEYCCFTPEAVAEAIAGLLGPYLADGLTPEDVRRQVGEISSVGGM